MRLNGRLFSRNDGPATEPVDIGATLESACRDPRQRPAALTSLRSEHPRQRRLDRLRNGGAALLLLAAFVFGGFATQAAVATPTPESDNRLYIAHSARFVADIPAEWRVGVHNDADYFGDTGFVFSMALAASTLESACAETESWLERFDSIPKTTTVSWRGHHACRVSGAISLGPVTMIVIPHGQPFERRGARTAFVAIGADPGHIDQIAATIDFNPERVTPRLFIENVIEIAEARSYWSAQVDWENVRRLAFGAIEGATTLEETGPALAGILRRLQAVGDNHSFLVEPDAPYFPVEATGYGFLVGGAKVALVFEGSPADLSGLRTGDILLEQDGQPFSPTLFPYYDLYTGIRRETVRLTIQRASDGAVIGISVTAGPYERYAIPWGGIVPFDPEVAMIGIPNFSAPGKDQAFAAIGNQIIAEAQEACGWVIDLRLNMGGSYTPMIGAIMSLLGDGLFGGWRFTDGMLRPVTLQDRQIFDDDVLRADFSEIWNGIDLSSRSIAVLIGPATGSAGEVTALAFVNRPGARLFGEYTVGATTANAGGFLFDGTSLVLAVAAMTDRTGLEFPDGVPPDHIVITDWQQYGTEDDPVLGAALAWLHDQPGCAS